MGDMGERLAWFCHSNLPLHPCLYPSSPYHSSTWCLPSRNHRWSGFLRKLDMGASWCHRNGRFGLLNPNGGSNHPNRHKGLLWCHLQCICKHECRNFSYQTGNGKWPRCYLYDRRGSGSYLKRRLLLVWLTKRVLWFYIWFLIAVSLCTCRHSNEEYCIY